MDLFVFTNPGAQTKMREGKLITKTLSKMWVERYLDAGEFTITAYAKTGIRQAMPKGSFISHANSTDIMMVENHQISDQKGAEPVVTVTGRSFETFLENRVVGSNHVFPRTDPLVDYVLDGHPASQAVKLIRDHISASHLANKHDVLPYVQVTSTSHGTGPSDQRVVKRGELYAALIDTLKLDDLGIKTVRPGPWLPDDISPGMTAFVIHKGTDRSATISFSYFIDEIDSADYLWSIKKHKNCALVSGRWVDVLVGTASTGINRRMMYVDANDIDQAQEHNPTGLARDYIVAAMKARGIQELAKQKEVTLVKADVTHGIKRAIYRKDYDLGDLVMVSGDFNETAKMRVSEYVEIEDQSGASEYPTLIVPTGDDSESS